MPFLFGETVRAGNNTARVKNYYSANGLIVLMDIRGTIEPGTTITGDDSGEVLTLSTFEISDDFDLYYEDRTLPEIIDTLVSEDLPGGELVAEDEHFTGKPSQDYQHKHLVSIG